MRGEGYRAGEEWIRVEREGSDLFLCRSIGLLDCLCVIAAVVLD